MHRPLAPLALTALAALASLTGCRRAAAVIAVDGDNMGRATCFADAYNALLANPDAGNSLPPGESLVYAVGADVPLQGVIDTDGRCLISNLGDCQSVQNPRWSTSNAGIFTVTPGTNGAATARAVAPGDATITLATDNGGTTTVVLHAAAATALRTTWVDENGTVEQPWAAYGSMAAGAQGYLRVRMFDASGNHVCGQVPLTASVTVGGLTTPIATASGDPTLSNGDLSFQLVSNAAGAATLDFAIPGAHETETVPVFEPATATAFTASASHPYGYDEGIAVSASTAAGPVLGAAFHFESQNPATLTFYGGSGTEVAATDSQLPLVYVDWNNTDAAQQATVVVTLTGSTLPAQPVSLRYQHAM